MFPDVFQKERFQTLLAPHYLPGSCCQQTKSQIHRDKAKMKDKSSHYRQEHFPWELSFHDTRGHYSSASQLAF